MHCTLYKTEWLPSNMGYPKNGLKMYTFRPNVMSFDKAFCSKLSPDYNTAEYIQSCLRFLVSISVLKM